MRDKKSPELALALDPRVAKSRKAILAAAARLLAAGGTSDISYTRLADEAGVGRATLYRHWPEPLDLLLEAMEIVVPEIELGEGPIGERLMRELGRRIDWFNSSICGAVIASIINRAAEEPRIRRMRDRTLGLSNKMLRDAIAQAARSGELRPDTPADLIAKGLVGTLLFDRHMLGNSLTQHGLSELVESLLSGWRINRPG
jgi:AcrR family transcriptional regulator